MTTNALFADHVTSVSFHLSLSRAMVFAMQCIADRRGTDTREWLDAGHKCDRFVPSVKALGARGLVTHEDPAKMKPKFARYPYSFTEAGEHVFALLVIAGLCREPVKRTRRKAA